MSVELHAPVLVVHLPDCTYTCVHEAAIDDRHRQCDGFADLDGKPFATEVHVTKDGQPAVEKIELFPILMCAHGDSPWSAKLAGACGHAALNGCWRCRLQGSQMAPNGAKLGSTAYGGYSDNTEEAALAREYSHAEGEWHDIRVNYAKASGGKVIFDRDIAQKLKTTDEDYAARAACSEEISLEELLKRAPADRAAAVENGGPPGLYPGDFTQAYNAANKRHLKLGASGDCVFSCLPYFRCVSRSTVHVRHEN